MKNLFMLGAVLLSVTLMSFTSTGKNPVTQIGKNLYQVDSRAEFSDMEKQVIMSIIKKEYNLGDWDSRVSSVDLEMIDDLQKRGWILKRKVFIGWVDEALIQYDSFAEPTPEGDEILNILRKHSRK